VEEALRLIQNKGDRLDGAVLDINLRNERVFPVADALTARGVPFLFTTGYDADSIPKAYAGAPRCEKPVDKAQLLRWLSHGALAPVSVSERWEWRVIGQLRPNACSGVSFLADVPSDRCQKHHERSEAMITLLLVVIDQFSANSHLPHREFNPRVGAFNGAPELLHKRLGVSPVF